MKKVIHISIAFVFILIGIVSGLLPFIPGFIFVIVGYLILGIYFPVLLKPIDFVVKKNPKMQDLYERAKIKVKNYL